MDKTTEPKPSKFEDLFESALYNCRFLVMFAVFGTMVAAATLFVKGSVEIIQGVRAFFHTVNFVAGNMQDDKGVILALIPALDNYLFATVLLIFSMGIYELFVSKINPTMRTASSRPNWLNIENFDDLKTHVAEVVIMILIINFFEFAYTLHLDQLNQPVYLLYFSGSILIVAATLYVSHKMIAHRKRKSDTT